jgi:hypothetical protein
MISVPLRRRPCEEGFTKGENKGGEIGVNICKQMNIKYQPLTRKSE